MKERKKIGIATWVGNISLNYGSILQATAMQKLVKDCGCKPLTISHLFLEDKRKGRFIRFLRNVFRKYGRQYICTYWKFKCWAKRYMNLSSMCCDNDKVIRYAIKCDILLCGSDSIWKHDWIRPLFLWDYEEINKPVISYAPSVLQGEIVYDIGPALKRFVAISGREKKISEMLSPFTDKKVFTVLDPTLAVESSFWENKSSHRLIKDDYLICYFISEPEMHHISVEEIRKKHNLKTVVYINTNCIDTPYIRYSDYQGNDYQGVVGPKEFLSLIRYAEVVCTDSFHGTCFSIVFKREFYVFGRERIWGIDVDQDYRFVDLFNRLSIEDRRIVCNDDIERIRKIDWEEVSKKLMRERSDSLNYLKTAIEKAKQYG